MAGKRRAQPEEPTPSEEAVQAMSEELPELEEYSSVISTQIDALRSKVRVAADAGEQEVLQAVLDGKWRRDVELLIPMNREVNPHYLFSIVSQIRRQPWLGFRYKAYTILQYARNVLADKFLAGEAEWSMWLDGDVIQPFGDVGFWKEHFTAEARGVPIEFAGVQTISRLMSHKKSVVQGVYGTRVARVDGRSRESCTQPGLYPQGPSDQAIEAKIRKGPMNEIVNVSAVMTGCLLIHRQVYLDIQAKFPELAPKKEGDPWDFFGHDVGVRGEDFEFSRRAKESGHSLWLDLGVHAAHIGNYAFFP